MEHVATFEHLSNRCWIVGITVGDDSDREALAYADLPFGSDRVGVPVISYREASAASAIVYVADVVTSETGTWRAVFGAANIPEAGTELRFALAWLE